MLKLKPTQPLSKPQAHPPTQQQPSTAGSRWLWGSALLAGIAIAGGGASLLILGRSPAPVSVRAITAQRSTVETVINESGTLELGGQQILVSPTEGAVEQVLVEPGDRVSAGQVLITLRHPERQTALLDQQVQIAKQQTQLARSQQMIVETQQQLAADQARLEDLQALAAAGAISRERVQDKATEVRTTLRALRDAETAARTAALELESLVLQQQKTQQELSDSVITAPLARMVLGVNVNDGDGVDRRTPLLTLGDPRRELVKLKLSTLNASQVQLRQLARVSVIGPDPTVFLARVVSLYPQAIAPTDPNQSQAVTVPTTVQLDRPTGKLIPGSQVNVEIVLAQRPNVVALAVEAIQRDAPQPFVWRLDAAGTAQPQPVTLGLEGLTQVEVKTGVAPGDRILLPPPDQPLTAGAPVTLQEATPGLPAAPAVEATP